MITENEHYRLELVPKWVRKEDNYVDITCIHCEGKGHFYEDELSFDPMDCCWCSGTGKRKALEELPPPPRVEMDFISFMRKAFQEYREKHQ